MICTIRISLQYHSWRHPAMSPLYWDPPANIMLKSPSKSATGANRSLGSPESESEAAFHALLTPSANRAWLREIGQNGKSLRDSTSNKPERRKMTRISSRSIQKGVNTVFKATEGQKIAMKGRWDNLKHSEDIKEARFSAKEYQEAAKSISLATSK